MALIVTHNGDGLNTPNSYLIIYYSMNKYEVTTGPVLTLEPFTPFWSRIPPSKKVFKFPPSMKALSKWWKTLFTSS